MDIEVWCINEVSYQEEESPLIFWGQISLSNKFFKKNKAFKEKEERINVFLSQQNIELIWPSEVNSVKFLNNEDCWLTPTLKLGSNSLLMKRRNKIQKNFSDYV